MADRPYSYIRPARSTRLISRFLDTNGDGTGTKNAIGNYAADTDFFIKPDDGEIFVLEQLLVHISDNGPMDAGFYGNNITIAAPNGIELQVVDDSGVVLNITDGVPVRKNGGWARYSHDIFHTDFGTGDNYVDARMNLGSPSEPVRLRGSGRNERLRIKIRGNFTGLTGHFFLVQGYIEE